MKFYRYSNIVIQLFKYSYNTMVAILSFYLINLYYIKKKNTIFIILAI